MEISSEKVDNKHELCNRCKLYANTGSEIIKVRKQERHFKQSNRDILHDSMAFEGWEEYISRPHAYFASKRA